MLKQLLKDFAKLTDDEVKEMLELRNKEINKSVKQVEDGQYIKIYEATSLKGDGIVVEGQGEFSKMLFFVAMAMANIIEENIDDINDVNGLVDTICEFVKDEVGGNK